MRALILLMLLSSSAFATTDQYGDMLTGSVTLPSGGAVVVDTGALPIIGSANNYYNFTIVTSCSLACILDVGIYNSNDTASHVYQVYVPAGGSVVTNWTKIPMLDNQKFKVKVNTGNLGTVTAALGLTLI